MRSLLVDRQTNQSIDSTAQPAPAVSNLLTLCAKLALRPKRAGDQRIKPIPIKSALVFFIECNLCRSMFGQECHEEELQE